MARRPTGVPGVIVAGSFLTVECAECGNEQTVFDKAATTVACNECDETLVTPGGGEASIAGEVKEVVQTR